MKYWYDSTYTTIHTVQLANQADNLLARALLAESLFGWMRFPTT